MKYKIFYRYLFSYIVIFLIPIVVITTMLFTYFMGALKREIASNNMNSIQSVADNIDSQLNQINNLREQIYINKNIRSFHFEDNPLDALNMISALQEYTLTNSFVDDIYVLYNEEKFLFSSKTSVNSRYFFENKYICNALGIEIGDRQGFFNAFSSNSDKYFKLPKASLSSTSYEDGGEQVIMHAYADYKENNVKRIIFFTILETKFTEMMNSTDMLSNANNIILNENNDIIMAMPEHGKFHDVNFSQLIEEAAESKEDEPWHEVRLDSESFIMSYVKSSFSGWKIISLVPEKIFFSKFVTTKIIFLIVLCIVLIVGGSFIVLLINKNYMPIRKLSTMSKTLMEDDAVGDELEVVFNAMNHLNFMNREFENRFHENERAIKEYLIFGLLNGKFHSAEEFNIRGEAVGFRLTKPLYRVTCLYIKSNLNLEWSGLIQAVERCIPPDTEGFIRDNTEFNKLVLVLAFDTGCEDKIDGILENIRMFIKGKTDSQVTMGTGNNYAFKDISKSLIEANSALDYRFIKGVDRIIHIDEISVKKTIVDKALEAPTKKLKTLIEHGELEPIENLLSNIMRCIKEGDMPVFSARMICVDIINTAVSVVEKLFDKTKKGIVTREYPDIFQLSEIETVDEIADVIRDVCMDISKLMALQKEDSNNISDIDRMIVYIKNNYTDCDWTLQMMADYFHMALPNLSSFFKQSTGDTLINYVSKLRIEKAKNILEKTNMRLKDICIKCGYYNVASFIRRFKQMEGMTPGEYREKFREE